MRFALCLARQLNFSECAPHFNREFCGLVMFSIDQLHGKLPDALDELHHVVVVVFDDVIEGLH